MEKSYTESNTGKVSCNICNENFTRKKKLKMHIDKVHCDLTQQTVSSGSKKKSNEEESTCQICGKRMSRKDSLKAHIKKFHSKTFQCNICNKILSAEKVLKEHIKHVHCHICEIY